MTTNPRLPWHARSTTEVVDHWQVSPALGLTSARVSEQLARFGPNALPQAAARSLIWIFLQQLKSPLIYLLFGAAVVALLLGHRSDAVVVVVVVLVNSVIGTVQEARAEHSLSALRRLASLKARVLRAGHEEEIEARAVVPGDVLLLAAGDAIAADARVLEASTLRVAEAPLTGESLPVTKEPAPLSSETPLGDRRNMVHAGTHVTAGRGKALVVATGGNTEVGAIAAMTGAARPPKTPLERRIERFGRSTIVIAVVLFAAVVGVGVLRGMGLGDIVMVAVSQVVGLIPEGLPVAMTIALSVGVQRMARRRAIVRRLSAVESLGATTVICTDKTGTLTQNEMTVTAIELPGRPPITVSGVGYDPAGVLQREGVPLTAATDGDLQRLLQAAVLCNDAHLMGPDSGEPGWRPAGDPTEVALLTVARKGGIDPEALRAQSPRTQELPFSAEAKAMATEHQSAEGIWVFMKGAPEVVLELCAEARIGGAVVPLDDHTREAVKRAAEALAKRALRVLTVAEVRGIAIDAAAGLPAFRGHATLLGLLGQLDPPRPEVAASVASCHAAGIRAVMVTGDHEATAMAIARSLGLAKPGARALDGRALAAMTDDQLMGELDDVAVFARVPPSEKLRLVELHQRRGHVVAMTGDGVNDAPALARADVGVAMGRSGTDVAKEAAAIVITDDNFATIVAAVEEGRLVHRSIKRIITLFLSTSFAEVSVLMLAMLLGYPAPFAAVQILWNNLVTEGLITVNMAMEPPEGDEMQRPPASPQEPLLTRAMLGRVLVMAGATVVCTLGWFTFRLGSGVPFAVAQTETFTLLAVCEWYNVLNCRSDRRSALTTSILKNRWLLGGLLLANLLQVAVVFWGPMNRLFHTVPIGLSQVLAIGVVASLVLWAEELRKLIVRHRTRPRGTAATEMLAHRPAR